MDWSRQFSLREKILLIILALLLLFSVYYFFVLRPVNTAIEKADMQAESLELDNQLLLERQQKYDDMKAELSSLKAAGDAAPVPEYDNLQQLMGFLNSVFAGAVQYDLSIQGVQQTEESTGNIVRRTMDMSFVSPSYTDARAAIEQLQRAPYCCQLSNLSIQPTNTSESKSILTDAVQVSLTVTFFESLF